MNNAPSSSASAAAYPDPEPGDSAHDNEQDVPLTAAEIADRRRRNRENFNKRRGELLDDLIRSIDLLVFAELSAIYYMEYV